MNSLEIIEEAIEKCEMVLVNHRPVVPISLNKTNTLLEAIDLGKVKTFIVNDCVIERWIDD